MLTLTREELIQICGIADGLRLNNALQSKKIRPRLTIYVNIQSESGMSTSCPKSTPDILFSIRKKRYITFNCLFKRYKVLFCARTLIEMVATAMSRVINQLKTASQETRFVQLATSWTDLNQSN